MQLDVFQQSIKNTFPPLDISVCLLAMWYDGCGDWEKAHSMVDKLEDVQAYWVHAYLHRKEGDSLNADYWYSKAGKKRPAVSLQQEWEIIVKALR